MKNKKLQTMRGASAAGNQDPIEKTPALIGRSLSHFYNAMTRPSAFS
jgi:hypothetical protein